ncbi:ATP-dependent Clp protease proteolytic subunit [Clostridium sp. D2Q-11]|uniref:ATP-dependent Clp protease proteolytic subunit n=1 Tax=Anaeromonas frigoriresistens TaxID=2683708 RepID=A0A942Z8L1_9FIRM|nr:ATP-dependent Clp protease proteolytic subunit [Anaeromonas frigoriresistens]MBS4539902.1 ATP-dependent Clp protease proteolytic subunit [Anaeromonas frigoriresistens]
MSNKIPNPAPKPNKESTKKASVVKTIESLGVTNVPANEGDIHFISIIGEIEGHNLSHPQKKSTKYEHIIPQLLSVQRNPDIKGLLVILNTLGGDVEAGLAISEMINSIKKPTVSLVLGGSHSIGVPLATSTNYSFITPSATMTLHPIRMTGLVIGVPQTFRYFQKMQERISSFILRTTKISPENLQKLIYDTDEIANDVGTILVGEEAVKYGLINEVGGLNSAIIKLEELLEQHKE